MNKIYLCGHTGSMNRGCEAIVRGTVEVLKKIDCYDITLLTFDKQYDELLNLNEVVELQPYPKKNFLKKGIGKIQDIFGNSIQSYKFYYSPLFKKISLNDTVFNIGGDTYCYGVPKLSLALNSLANDYDVRSVFWGCSVDENVFINAKMRKDVNKYSYIVSRESLSYHNLIKCVENKENVFLTCDPAFHLPVKKVDLPDNFKESDTLGINLSGLVFNNENDTSDIIYKNIFKLLDYIIKKTNMNICLIPHVYSEVFVDHDYIVLNKIYEKYKAYKRVAIVNRILSCTELKYIISKCRFFIGARTHATIAAYSTGVPAIALSYSVKSLGIAEDLFGTQDGYVISYKDISDENVLKEAFVNTLLKNETAIRERYEKILPEYKQSIIDVATKIIGN